jgi:uroporphyrinogen-III decarboxylase
MKREMTSRERLWAALDGQELDRVPIWMLYPRERLDYYVDVHNLPSYARVMPAIWAETDWLDRRSIPAPPLYTAAAQVESEVEVRNGWTIRRSVLHTPRGDLYAEHRQDRENASGARTAHYCQDISDLDKILSIPYEPVEPDLTVFHQAAKRLGDDGLMMVNIGMPIGVAYGLTHPETFAVWTLTEREALVRFTRAMFEREYAFFEKALEKGAGPVFFAVGTEFVAPPMCSPDAFDALITPFDVPLFELVHRYGGKVIVHHHGNTHAILERIADLGADGIQPIEEPPIGDCTMAQAKRRIGDRVCLIGSVQYDDFERLAPDQMEALVKRQIQDAAPGGGMILAPTAGPYATHLSERQQENTIRFIEAGRKWGRYPLRVA